MEHEDSVKVEMLRNEVDEIKANMESVSGRMSKLDDGPARALFASDLADMKLELAAREKELAALTAASPPPAA